MIEAGAIGGVLIIALAEAATMAIVLAGVGSKAFVGSLVGAVAGAVAFRELLTGAGGLASILVLLGNYAGWQAFNGMRSMPLYGVLPSPSLPQAAPAFVMLT
jgi:hypothetical protein